MFDTIRDSNPNDTSQDPYNGMDIDAMADDPDAKKEQIKIKTRLCPKYRKLKNLVPPGQSCGERGER